MAAPTQRTIELADPPAKPQTLPRPRRIILTPGMRVDPALRLAEPVPNFLPPAQYELITPQIAIEWLGGHNTFNRVIRHHHVRKLAADMASKRWKGLNGETIIFDADNRLTDGQQRLSAVVESGISIYCLVVRQVANDVYPTVGIGNKKTVADTMQPYGEHKNVSLLQSTCRMVIMWLDGHLAHDRNAELQPSELRIRDNIKSFSPDLDDSVNWVSGHQAVRAIMIPTVAALLHFAGTQGGSPIISDFLERVGDGIDLPEGSPAYQLRNFLLANKASKRKVNREYMMAMVIKAWNATLIGKSVYKLRIRDEEAFPVLEVPEHLLAGLQ